MTGPPDPKLHTGPDPQNGVGLTIRLWLGCLGAWLVVSGGLVWILSGTPAGDPTVQALLLPLGVVIALGLLAAITLAAWLSHGIVGRVRALTNGVAAGQIVDDEGKPWPGGWGEVGELGLRVQALLTRQRHLHWTADELSRLQRQIAAAHQAVEHWIQSERWESLPQDEGPVRPLADALNRGLSRNREVLEQNQEAVRQVRADLLACLEEARQSAEQVENGHAETVSLMESVQELLRLAGELQGVASAEIEDDDEEPSVQRWRLQATAAIEELLAASNESIGHLAAGFVRVQELGEQVHVLSNRAALIALNTLLGSSEEEMTMRGPAVGELKQLAREVRDATARVGQLSAEIEREVDLATEKMRGMRDRVALRLEVAPVEAIESLREPDDLDRMVDRAREVSQEALRRTERLQSSSERVSRSIDGVVRRLELEVRDVEGLVVRLTPTGASPRSGMSGGAEEQR